MIVEVLRSFKVTEGKVYIGGTTHEVDSFGALHPDVQKELIKKSGFFRLIDGVIPGTEEAPVKEPEVKAEEPEKITETDSSRTLPRKKK